MFHVVFCILLFVIYMFITSVGKKELISREATYMYDDYSGQFLRIFEIIIIFCCVVAICDLVHAVEATYGLP